MFEYVENEQLKNEIKKILIDCNITNKEVAERMGITPQTYQHLINKKQLSFSDVKRILVCFLLSVLLGRRLS